MGKEKKGRTLQRKIRYESRKRFYLSRFPYSSDSAGKSFRQWWWFPVTSRGSAWPGLEGYGTLW
jgi:hypothetical protein